jgi:hypothetical protein
MAKDRIPLNEMLPAIDRKDFGWYSRLPAERKKIWSSWLTLRYASTVSGKNEGDALLNTNEFVNKYYNDLLHHPDLKWRLFCLASSGKTEQHFWIKGPNNVKKKDKVAAFLSDVYPAMKAEDIALMRQINTDKELKQIAIDLAYSEKEVRDIFGKK